jgi:hypothetical protein
MIDHDTDAYDKIARAFVDGQPSGDLTRDNILDNITTYWLTGTGAAAARSYWEDYGADAPAAGRQALPPPPVPVGFTTFPGEIWRTPRSWAEQSYPPSPTFRRRPGAATSPPGRSLNSSRRRSGLPSTPCALLRSPSLEDDRRRAAGLVADNARVTSAVNVAATVG